MLKDCSLKEGKKNAPEAGGGKGRMSATKRKGRDLGKEKKKAIQVNASSEILYKKAHLWVPEER